MRQNSSSSLSLGYDGSAAGALDSLGRRVSGGSGGGSHPGGGYNVLPAVAGAAATGAFGPPPLATRSFNNSAIFVKMATNGGPTNGGLLQAAAVAAAGPTHQEYSLNVICSALINQDQLWRLFDIIPGLDYCQIIGESGPNAHRAIVKYNNLESCSYAKEKLHGLEYPLGERLIVKMDIVTTQGPPNVGGGGGGGGSSNASSSPGGGGGGGGSGGRPLSSSDLPLQAQLDGWDNNNLCSVTLPPPGQLAYAGSVCAQRCFLVCVSQVSEDK